MGYIVQSGPGSDLDGLARDPIWMAWPGFSQTHLVWKQAGVQESSSPVSGRTQPARYQFPTFRLGFRSSTDVPDNSVPNRPGSGLVLVDCVRFWPNGSGPEASQCARLIQPASGPTDPDRMQVGPGTFTGYTYGTDPALQHMVG